MVPQNMFSTQNLQFWALVPWVTPMHPSSLIWTPLPEGIWQLDLWVRGKSDTQEWPLTKVGRVVLMRRHAQPLLGPQQLRLHGAVTCRLERPLFFLIILFFKNTNYLLIWLHQDFTVACRIFCLCCCLRTLSCSGWDLVSWSGIEPGPPLWGAWSLSHWTTRKVTRALSLFFLINLLVLIGG